MNYQGMNRVPHSELEICPGTNSLRLSMIHRKRFFSKNSNWLLKKEYPKASIEEAIVMKIDQNITAFKLYPCQILHKTNLKLVRKNKLQ